MKKKRRCPVCDKKMTFNRIDKMYECFHCGYPDMTRVATWKKLRETRKKDIPAVKKLLVIEKPIIREMEEPTRRRRIFKRK